jgi:hypothetical protein
VETESTDEDRLPAHIDQVHQRLEDLGANEDQQSVVPAAEQAVQSIDLKKRSAARVADDPARHVPHP